MGLATVTDDPQSAVTDRGGRVHEHENLYGVDGSLYAICFVDNLCCKGEFSTNFVIFA